MEPNACWSRLCEAMKDKDWDEVLQASEELSEWLERGGARPSNCGESRQYLVYLLEQLSSYAAEQTECLSFHRVDCSCTRCSGVVA